MTTDNKKCRTFCPGELYLLVKLAEDRDEDMGSPGYTKALALVLQKYNEHKKNKMKTNETSAFFDILLNLAALANSKEACPPCTKEPCPEVPQWLVGDNAVKPLKDKDGTKNQMEAEPSPPYADHDHDHDRTLQMLLG